MAAAEIVKTLPAAEDFHRRQELNEEKMQLR
jgi:hypothetical protein